MNLAEKISAGPVSGIRPDMTAADLDWVMVELNQIRKQTERLDRINKLHSRIARAQNLSEMIEAYSVWLTCYIPHELIGYSNFTRKKQHLFCSCHGPERRWAIAFAEQIIDEDDGSGIVRCETTGHYAHKWGINQLDDSAILLVLKKGASLTQEQIDMVTASLDILGESLRRALDYEDLFEKASYDALTGLVNRRVFNERIVGMMESAKRYKHPLTLLSMDLDRFKKINDTLGHLAGDEVLKSVANVLKKAIRTSDLLVRMGGDEFLLVLDNTAQENAAILAERLCRAVEDLSIWADENTRLGISIGLAQLQQHESLKEWMERADEILYHAKDGGRSRIACE